MRRLSAALDYRWPVIGGLASWLHCIFGSERLARWQRSNDDYEPEVVG